MESENLEVLVNTIQGLGTGLVSGVTIAAYNRYLSTLKEFHKKGYSHGLKRLRIAAVMALALDMAEVWIGEESLLESIWSTPHNDILYITGSYAGMTPFFRKRRTQVEDLYPKEKKKK